MSDQGSDLSFVVSTRFAGCIVRCDLPRSDVIRSLPPGIILDEAPDCARDRHPVVFIFGHHDQSAFLFASLTFRTGIPLFEMVIGIPFVVTARGTTPSLLLPRVFSTEPVGTWSGNAHYAYAKRMVPIEWLGNTFVVSDERGSLLAHAIVEDTSSWERAATSRLTAFPAALGHMPVLGARASGDIVRSHFEWTFDDAWVRPMRARVTIEASLGRGLEAGVHQASATDCLEVSGMGWRLSWPEP